MMGFHDPNDPDPVDVAAFWDDLLKEFGPGAYVIARMEWAEAQYGEAAAEAEAA